MLGASEHAIEARAPVAAVACHADAAEFRCRERQDHVYLGAQIERNLVTQDVGADAGRAIDSQRPARATFVATARLTSRAWAGMYPTIR